MFLSSKSQHYYSPQSYDFKKRTVTEAAKQLGVTRAALSRIINKRTAISPEMVLRLEEWLGVENGGRADLWLGQQTAYDLWRIRKSRIPQIKRAEFSATI